jgi:hypothetical protein
MHKNSAPISWDAIQVTEWLLLFLGGLLGLLLGCHGQNPPYDF